MRSHLARRPHRLVAYVVLTLIGLLATAAGGLLSEAQDERPLVYPIPPASP